MKKTVIGIPRALMYYRYGVLWKSFFTTLGCKIILSPETNQSIIKLGKNNTTNDCCLPYQIYIGHTMYLDDKCDYLLVSRICDYGKCNKECLKLNNTYDNVKNLIKNAKIITYNLEYSKFKYEFFGFLKMGLKLKKNIFKVIYSYFYAKNKQYKYNITKQNEQRHNLRSDLPKILIVSRDYNINDNYISNYILKYLKKKDLTILFSNYLEESVSINFSEYFPNRLSSKYLKEMIGPIYYYRYQIKGIIFVSTNHCSIDEYVNNLAAMENSYLPILNIVIDENTSILNLETKLEAFYEILKSKKQ